MALVVVIIFDLMRARESGYLKLYFENMVQMIAASINLLSIVSVEQNKAKSICL